MHLAKSFLHVASVKHGTFFLRVPTVRIIKTDGCLELNDNAMHLYNTCIPGHLDM